ncbi:hypothetical protein GP486_008207, partial [Trichoglossum hirsutum]
LTTAQAGGSGNVSDNPLPNTTLGKPLRVLGGPTAASQINDELAASMNYVVLSLILSALLYYAAISYVRHSRTLTCLNTDRQLYFFTPNQAFAFIKKHVMDAPLFRKRHVEDLRLSSVVSGGALPTRLEFMLIAGTLGANIALSVVRIHWKEGREVVLSELRNRTGVLALGNLLPLFVIALRNNPLILLLNIPFEVFNMIHRWLGRIVALELLTIGQSWWWLGKDEGLYAGEPHGLGWFPGMKDSLVDKAPANPLKWLIIGTT